MVDNPTIAIKTLQDLPSGIKPVAGQRPAASDNSRQTINPLPASKQVKVVNRLIDYFQKK